MAAHLIRNFYKNLRDRAGSEAGDGKVLVGSGVVHVPAVAVNLMERKVPEEFMESVLPAPVSPGSVQVDINLPRFSLSPKKISTEGSKDGQKPSSGKLKSSQILKKPLSAFTGGSKPHKISSDTDERGFGYNLNSGEEEGSPQFMPESYDRAKVYTKDIYIEEAVISSTEKASFGRKSGKGRVRFPSLSRIDEEMNILCSIEEPEVTPAKSQNGQNREGTSQPVVEVARQPPNPTPQQEEVTEQEPVMNEQMKMLVQIFNQFGAKARDEILAKVASFDDNISDQSFDRQLKDCLLDLVKRGQIDPKESRGKIDQMLLTMTEVVSRRNSSVLQCINFREMAHLIQSKYTNGIQNFDFHGRGVPRKFTANSRKGGQDLDIKNEKASHHSYNFEQDIPSFLANAEQCMIRYFDIYCRESSLYYKHEKIEIIQTLKARVDSITKAAELFSDTRLVDNNYQTRDNLLYTPVITMPVPEPRHNIVYYYQTYTELRPAAAYSFSKLLHPIKEFITRVVGKMGKQEPIESSKLEKIELDEKMYVELQNAAGKAGLEISLQSFEQQTVLARYANSFNNLEDKTRVEKLSSSFIDKFLRNCLIPNSLVNYDLGMYKITLLSFEAMLKLHCCIILCRLAVNDKTSQVS